MKTYRKPNGDLNLDIDAVVKKYPEIAGASGDDAEQRVISVALVPYLIQDIKRKDLFIKLCLIGLIVSNLLSLL